MAGSAQAAGQWTSGLFDCFSDCNSCWLAYCCPWVVVGRLVNILDAGHTSCIVGGCIYCLLAGCACCYTSGYRGKLRGKFGLPEEPCNDCLVDCCCQCCSIAQNYRELQNRNIDPSLVLSAAL